MDNDFTSPNNSGSRTTTFTTDLQFLTFANDGGATTTQGTELDAANYNVRIAREWQVQNTGSVGAVNVKFDGSWEGYNLLEDTDGDFSTTGDQTVLATLDANGEATGISFTDGAYLTLAGTQVAPGGVPAALALWLKADTGVTDDGTNVSAWVDQSTNGRTATQVTAANQPLVTNEQINYNQTIDFNGTPVVPFDPNFDYLDLGTNDIGITNSLSVFYVVEQDQPTGENYVIGHQDGFDRWRINEDSFQSSKGIATFTSYTEVNQPFLRAAVVSDISVVQLIDGATITTDAYTSGNIAQTNNIWIGGTEIGGNFTLDGQLSEVIVYNTDISATEQIRIESYLALKYGISLDQTTATAYLASDGTTKMWDETADAAYNQGIFGIGRDDAQALDQRISKSSNMDGIFTVSLDNDFVVPNSDAARTTTFTSDLQFLTVANNGGATTTQSVELNTANYNIRISREWQVQNTGSVGAVNVKFDGAWEGFDLLEDTDGDFSTTGDQTVLATLDANGEATGITFTDGAYLTLAGTQVAPGGVTVNLNLWLKADGTILDGSNNPVSDNDRANIWEDQSGNNYDGTSAVPANASAVFEENYINFNPAVVFDGSEDHYSISGNALPGSNQSVSVYAVTNSESNSARQAIVSKGLEGSNTTFSLQINQVAANSFWG